LSRGDIVTEYWVRGDIVTEYWVRGDIVTEYWVRGDIFTEYWVRGDIVTEYWVRGDIVTEYLERGDIVNEYLERGDIVTVGLPTNLFSRNLIYKDDKTTFNVDTKDYVSKAVSGTKDNIVGVFDCEFPTPLFPRTPPPW
jgi:hypothetical protein